MSDLLDVYISPNDEDSENTRLSIVYRMVKHKALGICLNRQCGLDMRYNQLSNLNITGIFLLRRSQYKTVQQNKNIGRIEYE